MHVFAKGLAALAVVGGAASVAWSRPVVSASFQDEPDAVEASEALFIRAERIIVRPGEVIEDAAVLVRDGKILAVGKELTPPEGARELSATVVCAGFLDPWSALGLDPAVVRDTSTSAASRTVDGVDVYSNHHLRAEALRAGVTSVRVQSGASARVGGVGAVLRNDPDASFDDAVVLEDSNVAMSIGLTRGRSGPVQVVGLASATKPMDPFDRIAELDRVLQALEAGEKYLLDSTEYTYELEEWEKAIAEKEEELEKDFKKAKKSRDKKKEEAEEKDKEFKEKRYKEDKRPKPPKFDEDNETMARVVDGELPLVVQVHRAAEIRGLLEGTEKYERLRLVLAGGTEAARFAETLAARRIPVLVWPAPLGAAVADEFDGHDLSVAGQLAEAGVPVLIGSGGMNSAATRDLSLLASLAIGHGLDREKALEALTVGAARAFDLVDRVGSVERGKDADLLLLDGEPLLSTTRIVYVIAGGRIAVSPED